MDLIKSVVVPIVSSRNNGCMVQPFSVEAPRVKCTNRQDFVSYGEAGSPGNLFTGQGVRQTAPLTITQKCACQK